MVVTIPMSRIRGLNQARGSHWFEKDTMSFFKSIVGQVAYAKSEKSRFAYFISSEKHVALSLGINEPRKYSLRKADLKTGKIDTVGEFQAYSTKAQAKKELMRLVR